MWQQVFTNFDNNCPFNNFDCGLYHRPDLVGLPYQHLIQIKLDSLHFLNKNCIGSPKIVSSAPLNKLILILPYPLIFILTMWPLAIMLCLLWGRCSSDEDYYEKHDTA